MTNEEVKSIVVKHLHTSKKNEQKARRMENESKRSMKRSSTGVPKTKGDDDVQRLVREARQDEGVKNKRSFSASRGNSVRRNSEWGAPERTQAKSKRSSSNLRRDGEP